MAANGINRRYEASRRETFHSWTNTFIDADELAQLGFIYTQQLDRVMCVFCDIGLFNFVPEDDVLIEHSRFSPICPLLNGMSNNVPIDEESLQERLRAMPAPINRSTVTEGSIESIREIHNVSPETTSTITSEDIQGLNEQGRDETSFSSSENISAGWMSPVNPKYITKKARLETYDTWPRSMAQSPNEMSNAGFYYLKNGDKCRCYSCHGILSSILPNDDPYELHSLFYPNCTHMRLIKGEEFRQEMIEKREMMFSKRNKELQMKVPEEEEILIDRGRLCTVCYEKEFNVVAWPCRHLTCCAPCITQVTTCPTCRSTFTDLIRIYMT